MNEENFPRSLLSPRPSKVNGRGSSSQFSRDTYAEADRLHNKLKADEHELHNKDESSYIYSSINNETSLLATIIEEKSSLIFHDEKPKDKKGEVKNSIYILSALAWFPLI